MTDPLRSATPAAHARHDPSIIAALVARTTDLDATTETVAREQVATCDACARLLADLTVLQAALPETATPRRPRDFQLTPEDAHRLRRTGWRRLLGQIGSPRDGFSRPLAIGLTTLGLAGLLLASISSSTFMLGAGGAAPAASAATELAPINQAAPAPAAGNPGSDRSSVAGAAGPSAAASAPSDGQVFTGGNPDEVASDITGEVETAIRDDGSGLSVLFVVGGILLIAGLGLFALRWSVRRQP